LIILFDYVILQKTAGGEYMAATKRIFKIIEAIAKSGEATKIAEISRLSGVNLTTTYRTCSELKKVGYLYNVEKGKYFLSVKFIKLAEAVTRNFNISEIALPYLRMLYKSTEEHSQLAVLNDNQAVKILSVDSKLSRQQYIPIGGHAPLYCTAVGKAMLSCFTKEQFEEYIKSTRLIPLTPKTIIDGVQLKKEIEMVKEQGYAFDDEEKELGYRSIAAPIGRSLDDTLAALAIIGPKSHIENSKISEKVKLVMKYALRISDDLGLKSA
jgi:DNA-binding IclR family transcriptional regulator